DVVRAHLQEGEAEAAVLLRDDAGLHVGAGVTGRDLRARDRRSLWIGHASGEARVVDRFLRARAEGKGGEAQREHRGGEKPHEVPWGTDREGVGPSGRSVA